MRPPSPLTKLKTNDGKPGKVLWSALNSPIVSILVGPRKILFTVHEDLLTHHSSYCKSLLAGHFAEAKQKEIDWEDEDPNVVKLFVAVAWLYSREIDLDECLTGAISRNQATSVNGIGYKYSMLFRLWVLADKRDVEALRNAVVAGFTELLLASNFLPSIESMIWAWENTMASAKIRSVIVDSLAITCGFETFNTENMPMPHDFYLSLLRAIPKFRTLTPFVNGNWKTCWIGVD